MFTPEDREELVEIFEKLKASLDETLENDSVLPSHITHNGDKVGITIELRKFYNNETIVDNEPPLPNPQTQANWWTVARIVDLELIAHAVFEGEIPSAILEQHVQWIADHYGNKVIAYRDKDGVQETVEKFPNTQVSGQRTDGAKE